MEGAGGGERLHAAGKFYCAANEMRALRFPGLLRGEIELQARRATFADRPLVSPPSLAISAFRYLLSDYRSEGMTKCYVTRNEAFRASLSFVSRERAFAIAAGERSQVRGWG